MVPVLAAGIAALGSAAKAPAISGVTAPQTGATYADFSGWSVITSSQRASGGSNTSATNNAGGTNWEMIGALVGIAALAMMIFKD